MNRFAAFVLGALMVSTAFGAGFKAIVGFSTGDKTDVSCTTIPGDLGIINDWTHKKLTSKKLQSEGGEVGAKWDGEQYPRCPPLAADASEDSACVHRYEAPSPSSTKISIELTTETDAKGTAEQQDSGDPSWWWSPTAMIHDTTPVINMYDREGNHIGEVGWSNITDGYDHISVRGAGGANPGPPGGTLHAGVQAETGGAASGRFEADTGTIFNSRVKRYEVEYHVYSSANRDSDNVKVTNWKVFLKSKMITWVTP